MYSSVWWIFVFAEKRHQTNSQFVRQPLPSLPAITDCCQGDYL